jgi:hypothetical protein
LSPAATEQRAQQASGLQVFPVRGWHLPFLQDPCFIDLLPLLQRSVLLEGPEKLLHSIAPRPPLAPEAWLAYRDPQQPLGLVIAQRLNRSGSCWQLLHLRSSDGCLSGGEAGRMAVESILVREAIQRSRNAASWIATSASTDNDRLAVLRQQGFQPLRRETLWRWEPQRPLPMRQLPRDLLLRPLNSGSATAMWHLDQAALPAQLRQLLDRRSDDLLDQSARGSLMLIDSNRRQAVAAVRRLRNSSRDLPELELCVHPGWRHLIGEPLQLLLERCAGEADQLVVRSDLMDQERSTWLHQIGLVPEREEVVMARSVWRRHATQPNKQMAHRLEAVLGRLQPGQQPIPTPLGR